MLQIDRGSSFESCSEHINFSGNGGALKLAELQFVASQNIKQLSLLGPIRNFQYKIAYKLKFMFLYLSAMVTFAINGPRNKRNVCKPVPRPTELERSD